MASANLAANLLNSLTRNQLTEAVRQIINHAKFSECNGHVPVADRPTLRARILSGNWPDYPIFSPYAKTHDGYSQSKHRYPFKQCLTILTTGSSIPWG